MEILLAYVSVEGLTRRVAARIAEIAREAGHLVHLVDIADETLALAEGTGAVILAAPVHGGAYPQRFENLVRDWAGQLTYTRNALVSVEPALGRGRDRDAAEAVVARLSGARERVGYALNGRSPLLTRPLPVKKVGRLRPIPMVDYYLAMLEQLGVSTEGIARRPQLSVSAEQRAGAEATLRAAGHLLRRMQACQVSAHRRPLLLSAGRRFHRTPLPPGREQ